MDRVSFIYRTDIHAAEKSPISWKGDYKAEILSSLRQIGVLAKDLDVTAVLDGGDFFHVKSAVRTPHSLVIQIAEIHDKYPCKVYCIEGNHDITGNNLETLSSQPLGVLYATGTFQHLREETFVSGSVKVRVVGLPYDPRRTLEDIQTIRKTSKDEYLVIVLHALAGENPPSHVEEFFGEPVFRYSTLVYEDGPDCICFGHWHVDQGIVQISKTHFVNQGAVSRGSLSKDNLTRVPNVSLLEFTPEGITTRVIPLSVAPPEDVYDIERKERQEKESLVINQFVDQINLELQVGDDEDISVSIEQSSVAAEVKQGALAYLEAARAL